MKKITKKVLDDLTAQAAALPRKRKNFNLHDLPDDPVQRLFNAIEPGTYIRPHRHSDPSSWEVFLMVRGAAVFITFDNDGTVQERLELRSGGPGWGVEISAGTWHTIASLQAGSVFFEVKKGPYVRPAAGNAAAWSPEEGDPDAGRFEAWFRTAQPGDTPPEKSS